MENIPMNAPHLKVLVVDDEPDVVEFLSYNLLKENFEVVKAYDGISGIEMALSQHPDVIIMDVRMPGMTGIEACRKIKSNESMKNIRILFLTADNDQYTTLNAIDAGGDHFITKPIRPSLIIGMIKELIN